MLLPIAAALSLALCIAALAVQALDEIQTRT